MARIFLAGAESLDLLTTLVDAGAQDIMMSFYYLQQRGALPKLLAFIQKHPHLRILLDSGATTFVQKDRGNPQPYWKAYFEFLRGRGHHFEYATEFDIDGYTWVDGKKTHVVSDEQISVWRDDLAELETVKIVPVWHESRGLEHWDWYCQDTRFPHIGISKGEGSEISTGGSNKKGGGGRIFKGGGSGFSRGAIQKLIAQAHGAGKTVHGYGTPTLTDLKQITFDTIASTTWLVGQKFGDVCIFERGQYQRIYSSQKNGKKDRQKYRKYFTRLGCDWKKIEADDRDEINKANVMAWVNLSARLQVTRPSKVSKPTLRLVPKPKEAQEPVPAASESTIPLVDDQTQPTDLLPVLSVPEAPSMGKVIPIRPVGETVSVSTTTEAPISIATQKPFMPPNIPGLHCSICSIGIDCPKHTEGAMCAFKKDFQQINTQDVNAVVEELGGIFQVNVERARYARLMEELVGGGAVSKEVTQHMETTFQMGAKLAELMKGRKKTKTTVQGEGLLSRLFDGIGGPVTTTIEADPPAHALPEESVHSQVYGAEEDDDL